VQFNGLAPQKVADKLSETTRRHSVTHSAVEEVETDRLDGSMYHSSEEVPELVTAKTCGRLKQKMALVSER
jgi:hypothetical protein